VISKVIDMDFPIIDNTKMDDAALIQLLTLKQVDALSDLYDRYSRLVFSIAFRIVGDQAAAEEIVQDVFTRVWEKAYTYDAKIARVSTWLINITRNRAIDEIRKLNGHHERANVNWEDVSPSYIPFKPGPEEETELAWQKQLVIEALGTLSPIEREVLSLAYYEGYPQSKIAAILGVPLGTIKTRVRVAMQKLRLVLSSEKGIR
jgi:RNA polymerase sigma-70 factor (ECF subfamily)